MSEAGEFVDAALQREGSWYRADEEKARLGSELQFYGASVGAVRGTIRDAGRRYPNPAHDDVTALSSELWAVPVFERRLASVVLLQTHLPLLNNSDLTRLEGFVRSARLRALVDPLATDVIGPLREGLDATGRARADITLDRWAREGDPWLRRAALLSPLRALRAGEGDWAGFSRRATAIRAESADTGGDNNDGEPVHEAISLVLGEMARSRPDVQLAQIRPSE